MEPVVILKRINRINYFLIISFVVSHFLKGPNILTLLIFILSETLLYLGSYLMVIRPLRKFEEYLDKCCEAELDKISISEVVPMDTLYVRKIQKLVDKYADQKNRVNSAEMFDRQAELAALQSQINPHFLYNTLESIRGQALIDDNEGIAKMVEALASFFRYSINRKGAFVTLRDELSNIQNYMTILQYRFNNRFSMDIYVDEEDKQAYDFFIPKLILQPIVENAVFHGLEECLEDGKVTIEVIATDNSLILTVSDNGKGMDEDTLQELNARIHKENTVADTEQEKKQEKKQRNTGIALPNIHKRIQLLYGSEYGVNVYSTSKQGTDVEITIPANHERVRSNEEGTITYS